MLLKYRRSASINNGINYKMSNRNSTVEDIENRGEGGRGEKGKKKQEMKLIQLCHLLV